MTLRHPIFLLLAVALISPANARESWKPPTDGPVLFFGDSITEGWMDAVKYPALAYPAVFDSLLHAAGSTRATANLGRAGETTDDALLRMETDVLARVPAVVVIAFGSNDWYIHGYATQPRVSLKRFIENLRLLIWKIRGIGAVPVLLGIPPVIADRYYRFSPQRLYAPFGGVAAHRASYDSAIAGVAADSRVAYIPIMADTSTASMQLGMDGLHPTATEHRNIAAALLAPIDSVLRSGSTPPDPRSGITVFPTPVYAPSASRLFAQFSASGPGHFRFHVFASSGRELRDFEYSTQTEGTQYISWDCVDNDGVPLPHGTYLLVLESKGYRIDQKFIIL